MNNLLNGRSSRGLACLMLSGILSVGIVGCDFLGLDGPGGTVGALGFDDVAGSNCAEGSAPAEPTVERPLPVDVSTARVYLTLGLISEYSQGIHRLAEKLEALDIQSRVINKSELDAATSDIVSEYEQSGGAIDIFLIGHSYGSDDAIALAANLDDAGIPVRLLVVLDASSPPER